MERLPPELIDNAFRHLDGSDLKNCRLVSRRFCAEVTPKLFHGIHIHAITDGLKKLCDLSDHPEIPRYVRKITYDTRMLPLYKFPVQWQSAAVAALKIAAYEVNWADHLYRPYKPTDASYSKYEEAYAAQFVGKGDDLIPLKQAIKRFPDLRAIELYSGYDHRKGVEGMVLEGNVLDFGHCFRDTCTMPSFGGGYGLLTSRTRSLLAASNFSRSSIRSMTLDVRHDFVNASKHLHVALEAVQLLTSLSLRVFMPKHLKLMPSTSETKRNTTGLMLTRFIGGPGKLKVLNLAFRFVGAGRTRLPPGYGPNAADIKTIMVSLIAMSPEYFSNLKQLTLDGAVTTVNQLLDLLPSIRGLESLELKDIMLEAGSWLTLLRGLASTLKLDHLALRGRMTSLREQWETRVEDDAGKDETTLRRKLEQYVESGGSGQFPLFPEFHPKCYYHHPPSIMRMMMYAIESAVRSEKDDLSFKWIDVPTRDLFLADRCEEDCPVFDDGQESVNEDDDLELTEMINGAIPWYGHD